MSLTDRASRAVEDLLDMRRVWRLLTSSKRYEELTDRGVQMQERMALSTLEFAEPLWWDRQIVDAIASAPLTEDWTLRPELFPLISGYALLAQPLKLPVTEEWEEGHLAAFSWVATGTSLTLAAWKRMTDGILVPITLLTAPFHTSLHDITSDKTHHIAVPHHMSDRRQNVLIGHIGACLLFLEQKVATSAVELPDRAARRRFQRANIQPPTLRVVRLRSRESATDRPSSATSREWHCQWLVRRHWRKQFYPSDGSRRPRVIELYMKGPKDKPVRVSPKSVYAVVR